MTNPQVEEYKRQLNAALDGIDDKLLVYPIVQQVSTQAKVRPAYLASGVLLFLVLFIFYGFGGRLVANLVGFGYPLYESFGSLKRKPSPGTVDEEDTQWLTYWVVYSTFTLLESFSDFLQVWIPLYHVVKIAFLLWCMLPQTQGALLIYHNAIEPILVRYEASIDAGGRHVKNASSEVGRDIGSAGSAAVASKKRQMVNSAIDSLIGPNNTGKGSASAAPAVAAAAQQAVEEHEAVVDDELDAHVVNAAPGGPIAEHSKTN